jgi:hypothetical protein
MQKTKNKHLTAFDAISALEVEVVRLEVAYAEARGLRDSQREILVQLRARRESAELTGIDVIAAAAAHDDAHDRLRRLQYVVEDGAQCLADARCELGRAERAYQEFALQRCPSFLVALDASGTFVPWAGARLTDKDLVPESVWSIAGPLKPFPAAPGVEGIQ